MILAASAPSDWRELALEDTLYLDLDRGRVIVELVPRLAPQHVANIKALVREGYFDGLAFYRAQDNYVTAWLAHCYGAVGVARGNDPASGSGTDLYAVIGHAPRHLDRNITVVGRVVQGMELLSTLPRGPAPMGFYGSAAERTPIRQVRVAADVPAAGRTALQVIRTDTATFAELTEARRNRIDDWNKVPAGHIELCNVPLPTRRP
ncbi:MAG: putative secreted peptidyl prolyl cis-trans isomerase, cyclophilin type protein [Proteobacteria bacterium]|nr:putative secreted peptidyl prolyl cis-trans isomerase, cyclophilin type protein [Pseudomonadota bacterium]